MSTVDLTVNMASDWLKWEEAGWYSRENGVLAQPTGLPSGSILGKAGNGKLMAIDPNSTSGLQNPVGILLHDAPPSAGDLRVAYIAREAIVADKALKFPAGTTAPQMDTAFAALEALGIQVREGV